MRCQTEDILGIMVLKGSAAMTQSYSCSWKASKDNTQMCSKETIYSNRQPSHWTVSTHSTQKTLPWGLHVKRWQMRDGRKIPNVAFIFCLPGVLESLESLLMKPLRETKEKESFSSLSEPIWVAFIWQGVFCVCVYARLKGWEQSIFNVAVIWRTHKYCIWDVLFFWTKFLNRFACYGSIIGIFIITLLTPSCFKGLMTQNKYFLEFECGILNVFQELHFFVETFHGKLPKPFLGNPEDPKKEIAAF